MNMVWIWYETKVMGRKMSARKNCIDNGLKVLIFGFKYIPAFFKRLAC